MGRRGYLSVAVLLLASLPLTACGEGAGADRSGGWKALETAQLSLFYPASWKALPKRERGDGVNAAASLTKDGREVAKVGVQLRFISRGDAELAVGAASAAIEFHGRIEGRWRIDVPGAEEAQRVDYVRIGDGAPGKAPDGAAINGIDVVGVDAEAQPFLVRINATSEGADRSELERIAGSVELKAGG
ncbi:hypothetical protein [Streptomyces sp. TP-A0874]|uniref:hypothetical protein n=1 Tax=Streptomyces sp. TP-A0874 TaxID=549819 RepID=UPI000853897B|nr:hypothetical protein [Streptomyces sp. TP-A0874]